ncbi:MAG: hypothetical protein H7Z41_05620 [Cytophagales bacterium]|nr:hypothetical protein [Armatimonadota bacterium]
MQAKVAASGVTLTLTTMGKTAAPVKSPPISQRQLLAVWQKHLSVPQGRILEYLWERRGISVSRREIAGAIEVSESSSGFRSNLTALRTLGLIHYPDSQTAAATELILVPGLLIE